MHPGFQTSKLRQVGDLPMAYGRRQRTNRWIAVSGSGHRCQSRREIFSWSDQETHAVMTLELYPAFLSARTLWFCSH